MEEKFLSVTGKKQFYERPENSQSSYTDRQGPFPAHSTDRHRNPNKNKQVKNACPHKKSDSLLSGKEFDNDLGFLFQGETAEKGFFEELEKECQETGCSEDLEDKDLKFLFDNEDPEKMFFHELEGEKLESEEMYWFLPELVKKRKAENPAYYEQNMGDLSESDILLAAQDICGKKDFFLAAVILYVLLENQDGTFQDVHSMLASSEDRLIESFLELFDCHPAKKLFLSYICGAMTEKELEEKAVSLAEWLGDPEKLKELKVRNYLLSARYDKA